MNEQTSALHNMSSAPRTTASWQPRPIEPPPVKIRGKNVRVTEVGIKIALDDRICQTIKLIAHDPKYPHILLSLLAPSEKRNALWKGNGELEDILRDLANEEMHKHRLIGCVLMQTPQELNKNDMRKLLTLKNSILAFAILTKSWEHLFIVNKTPNLDPILLERKLVTFDPRLVELGENE